jgi:hypothetical protein
VPEFSKFKVITPITKEEVIDRCEKMLFAGIALKQETIESILNILDELGYSIDIDKVKNKEAKNVYFTKPKAFYQKSLLKWLGIGYLATEKNFTDKR